MAIDAKPFVKWAGGKSKLSSTILDFSSTKLDFDDFDTYMEPFVGGGGMFFAVANQHNFKKKIISDNNLQLINTYKVIKENVNGLITELDKIQNEFNALPSMDDKKEYYLFLRATFNKHLLSDNLVKQSSLLIALNKLGFNGLYRVNGKGEFNVPFGQKKTANLYSKNNLHNVNHILQTTEIYHLDFRDTIEFVDEKTLVYIDSPYRPLPGTQAFKYQKSDFDDNDQIELAEYCQEINHRNGSFILSNSDPIQKDPNDFFFDDLYKDFDIARIDARRSIGATASRRGVVSEILVIGQ
ncbi:DNA adenine methylase [Fundicoccus culcitae]|uniref:site-specific DNA-methyltransferase (adenine-specific) n=1 Tax=Fundicoccus culcitae TaxID=2969821 RepID=A0ABY5P4L7_9LACT|nr:Dam family site-specific DNA-(adenine-N6)-methyltransferase [Fundicoccus culcitae]UUX33550.1 Dam family site-specific DNA-(adenine-N6)-methyltransferase [Fundicoccus culcitae]